MTGPSSLGGPRFGLNVTAFRAAYPGWTVTANSGVRLRAWRCVNGHVSGPGITARTLDELAEIIDFIDGDDRS